MSTGEEFTWKERPMAPFMHELEILENG